MKLLALFIASIVFLSLAGGGVALIYGSLTAPIGETSVDCFDRYGNLIEGLECTRDFPESERKLFILFGILLIVFGGIVSPIVYDIAKWEPPRL